MARLRRIFNGKPYYNNGWTRYKADAEQFADNLRKRNHNAIVVEAQSADGINGYRVFRRKL